jgi:very-short-patch-repair endonuclease
MRHAPTPSEARLFAAVRRRRLGVSFRRQVPVLGKYIVDLLAPEVRLVVEVDVGYHGHDETPTRGATVRLHEPGTACCGSTRSS